MTGIPEIFDRRLRRLRRDRAAALDPAARNDSGFLFREVAERLADRLLDVDRRFADALDLGCRAGEAAYALRQADPEKVARWVHADSSPAMAKLASTVTGGVSVAAEEDCLPFAECRFDLVLSNLSLHWVNDLPGALVQANRALKPDGLFQAAVLGGETLNDLRECLMTAELEISGGASPRVSPMTTLRDAGALMQRAGFALPVTDFDVIDVSYPHALKLMADLRAMGEGNAVLERRSGFAPRGLFPRAAALYQERHGGADGRITARFEVIYLHGWHPHAAQPKPLRPGSAEARLADALDTREGRLPGTGREKVRDT